MTSIGCNPIDPSKLPKGKSFNYVLFVFDAVLPVGVRISRVKYWLGVGGIKDVPKGDCRQLKLFKFEHSRLPIILVIRYLNKNYTDVQLGSKVMSLPTREANYCFDPVSKFYKRKR